MAETDLRMPDVPTHLPSTRALQAFIAVARYGSLAAAALELGLSVPALSRRIRGLETFLGAVLFERSALGLNLTASGSTYLSSVTPILGELTAATRAIRSPNRQVVRISTIPAFAVRWLLPRLAAFAIANPSIEVEVSTSQAILDLETHNLDLAIRLEARSGAARPLLPIDLVPVWAAGRPNAPHRPEELLNHLLLSPEHRPEFWVEWLGAHALDATRVKLKPVDNLLLYELTLTGAGVAIGIAPLTDTLVAEGRLTIMSGFSTRSHRAFYLIRRPSKLADTAVRTVSDWLEEAAEGDVPPVSHPAVTRVRR